MTDGEAAFDAWLESYEEPEQLRVDLVRIRGYALACAEGAAKAKAKLDKVVTAMMRARKAAERELIRCNRACDRAERATAFAARAMAGDVEQETRREAATALEELFG